MPDPVQVEFDQTRRGSVERNGICADHLIFHDHDIAQVHTARTAFRHDAVSIHHIQVGLTISAAFRNALMQVIAMKILLGAFGDRSHQIFHAAGHMRPAVMFQDRNVDEDIALPDQTVLHHLLETFCAGDLNFRIIVFQICLVLGAVPADYDRAGFSAASALPLFL